MSANYLSTDSIMLWHAFAPALAMLLLALTFIVAVFQFAVAGSSGRAARFLNGGSLRVGLLVGLILASTVPAAALGLLLAERSAHLRHERIASRLEESANAIARSVDQFIDKHRAGIESAARAASAAGRFDRTALTQHLLTYHGIYDDFLTMLCADRDGDIVTATSNMTGFLAPVDDLRGHNVADRPYFQGPMSDGRVFVSKVFQGRDLGRDPIVAISAALRDFEQGFVGIIEGSLNLRAFEQIDEQRPNLDGAAMILVDQDSRVIYASPVAGLIELQSIASDTLIESADAMPAGKRFDYLVAADGIAEHYLGVAAPTNIGWRVFLRVPLRGITQQMIADYRLGGLLLFGACIISMLLAGSVARRVTRSVEDLNRAVASFTVDGSGDRIKTPGNTPKEFLDIFAHMRRRSEHLQRAYARLRNSIGAGEKLRRELTRVVARKELEIAERTADLEEANQRLDSLSKIDPLTGLANRREFDAFEQRIWRLGAREGKPVGVILLDVDYFKIYNDTLGHQAGDECLQQIAGAVKECATRPLDLVARYGGEEFIAIMGGATVADALVVANRMRQAVCALELPHPGSSHSVVTVSVGAASAQPRQSDDAEQLIKAADEALYYAKAAGRNCVVFRKDDEYVTYDPEQYDSATTNVIQILAGGRPKRKRG